MGYIAFTRESRQTIDYTKGEKYNRDSGVIEKLKTKPVGIESLFLYLHISLTRF